MVDKRGTATLAEAPCPLKPPDREQASRVKEAYELERRREEQHHRRIVQRILFDARKLDVVVDECEVTADPELLRDLLVEGLSVGIHGIDVVVGEAFVQDPRDYLVDVKMPVGWDFEIGLEALREDAASLKIFLSAKSRILIDLGLSPNVVARTRSAMAYVIVGARATIPADLAGQVSELRNELLKDQERLRDPADYHKIWRRLSRVLEAFGGVLLILSDRFVSRPTAPVTAGFSVCGTALSQVIGVEVLNDRVRQAHREGT